MIRKRPLQRCEAALGTNKKHRALTNTLQLKHFSQYKKQRKLFPNVKNNSFTCVKVDEFSKKTDGSELKLSDCRLEAEASARVHFFSLVPVPPTRAPRTSLMSEYDVTEGSGLNTPQ